VNLIERPSLAGHVVTVLSGQVPVPDDEPGMDWFTVTASWARDLFDGRDLQVPRRCLLPMCPPPQKPREARKHTPVVEQTGE